MATNAPEPRNFMKLPPEIRTLVYEHFFSNVLLQSRPYTYNPRMLCCGTEPTDHYWSSYLPSILSVSKVIRSEALPIFLSNMRIGFPQGTCFNDIHLIPQQYRDAAKMVYINPKMGVYLNELWLPSLEEVRVRICDHKTHNPSLHIAAEDPSDEELVETALAAFCRKPAYPIITALTESHYRPYNLILEAVFEVGDFGERDLVSLEQEEPRGVMTDQVLVCRNRYR